jgi:AraC-like DNA-binding protein
MPRRGHEVVQHAGETVHSDARVATVVGQDGRLRMRHAANTEKLFVRIAADALERRCRQQLGAELRAPVEFAPRMPLDAPRSASWLRLVHWLCSEGRESLFDSPLFAAQIEQTIITALLLCQARGYQERFEAAPARAAPSAVRRAERYIEDHAHEAISVDDVAEAAGVGTRALFVNFRRHRGTTPMQYLKHVRLDRVHAELLAANPRKTTVTGVAMQWGFVHLGHFTSAFKARFGELPSEVLAR